uniref:Uncharacterized protein n=1 Tax=Arundo donax TaxID=35708 RepID=A0A0A9F1Y5_ARUDO
MHDCRMTGPPEVSTWPGKTASIHRATGSISDAPPVDQSLLSGSHGGPPCMAILIRPGNSIDGVL